MKSRLRSHQFARLAAGLCLPLGIFAQENFAISADGLVTFNVFLLSSDQDRSDKAANLVGATRTNASIGDTPRSFRAFLVGTADQCAFIGKRLWDLTDVHGVRNKARV